MYGVYWHKPGYHYGQPCLYLNQLHSTHTTWYAAQLACVALLAQVGMATPVYVTPYYPPGGLALTRWQRLVGWWRVRRWRNGF